VNCLECERLNEEEAEAAIELVAADTTISPEAMIGEREIQKGWKLAAEIRGCTLGIRRSRTLNPG
jgi:hypothetical protein